MIKAAEARANVISYETAINADITHKVDELLDIMDKSIQFHSQNGYTSLTFTPYDKSRFSTVYALEYAQELFTQRFEDAGYTILENHYGKNNLKIEW